MVNETLESVNLFVCVIIPVVALRDCCYIANDTILDKRVDISVWVMAVVAVSPKLWF
jgi:hypothetical protein